MLFKLGPSNPSMAVSALVCNRVLKMSRVLASEKVCFKLQTDPSRAANVVIYSKALTISMMAANVVA